MCVSVYYPPILCMFYISYGVMLFYNTFCNKALTNLCDDVTDDIASNQCLDMSSNIPKGRLTPYLDRTRFSGGVYC